MEPYSPLAASPAARRPWRRTRLTAHAVERYQERVEPGISAVIAREQLGALVDIGQVRSTPRHWMRGRITMTPGLRFLYPAQRPGVCALLIGDAVVTVVTRSMFAGQPWLPTKPVRTEPEAA